MSTSGHGKVSAMAARFTDNSGDAKRDSDSKAPGLESKAASNDVLSEVGVQLNASVMQQFAQRVGDPTLLKPQTTDVLRAPTVTPSSQPYRRTSRGRDMAKDFDSVKPKIDNNRNSPAPMNKATAASLIGGALKPLLMPRPTPRMSPEAPPVKTGSTLRKSSYENVITQQSNTGTTLQQIRKTEVKVMTSDAKTANIRQKFEQSMVIERQERRTRPHLYSEKSNTCPNLLSPTADGSIPIPVQRATPPQPDRSPVSPRSPNPRPRPGLRSKSPTRTSYDEGRIQFTETRTKLVDIDIDGDVSRRLSSTSAHDKKRDSSDYDDAFSPPTISATKRSVASAGSISISSVSTLSPARSTGRSEELSSVSSCNSYDSPPEELHSGRRGSASSEDNSQATATHRERGDSVDEDEYEVVDEVLEGIGDTQLRRNSKRRKNSPVRTGSANSSRRPEIKPKPLIKPVNEDGVRKRNLPPPPPSMFRSSNDSLLSTESKTPTDSAVTRITASSDKDSGVVSDENRISGGSLSALEEPVESEDADLVSTGPVTRTRFTSRFFRNEPLYQMRPKSEVVEEDETACDSGSDFDEENIYETFDHFLPDVIPENVEESSMEHVAMKYDKTGKAARQLWCEMNEVKESGILDQVPDDEKKIQEAMFEVITSEASYLKSLNILIDVFINSPWLSQTGQECCLASRDAHVLFSNILTVHHTSQSFLRDLEARWQENVLMSDICDVIIEHAEGPFEVYIKYCSNTVYQDRKLQTLMKTNSKFAQVVTVLQRAPECQGLPLGSFLLLPMQRITRMPLLIDALCRRLPEGSDRQRSAHTAWQRLSKLVQQCNEGARKMEQMEELCLIKSQLTFKVKELPIVSSSRYLVKRGELTHLIKDNMGKKSVNLAKLRAAIDSKKKSVYLFVFNDYVLVCKKRGDERYDVSTYASRNSVVAEVMDEEKLTSSNKYLFLLALLEDHDKKQKQMLLAADSAADRTRWIEALCPKSPETPDDETKIYEQWDCPLYEASTVHEASDADELSLQAGDLVDVTKKLSDEIDEAGSKADDTVITPEEDFPLQL